MAYFPSTCFPRATRAGRGSERPYLRRAAAPQPIEAFETFHCEILARRLDHPRMHGAGPPLSPQDQRSNARQDAQGRGSRSGSASRRTKRSLLRGGRSLSHFVNNILALRVVTICFSSVLFGLINGV